MCGAVRWLHTAIMGDRARDRTGSPFSRPDRRVAYPRRMLRRVVALVAVVGVVVGPACDEAPSGAVADRRPVPAVALDVPEDFVLGSDRSPSGVAAASAQWLGPADPRTGLRSGISVHVFCDDRPLRELATDHGALRRALPTAVRSVGPVEPVDVPGADEALLFDVDRSGESISTDERFDVRSQELLAAAAGRTIHVIVATPLGDLAPDVTMPEDRGHDVLSSVRVDQEVLPSC